MYECRKLGYNVYYAIPHRLLVRHPPYRLTLQHPLHESETGCQLQSRHPLCESELGCHMHSCYLKL